MIQNVLVGLLFLSAVIFIGRVIYKNFTANSSCASGCGKCGAIDFNKIEQELKNKGI